MVAQLNSCLSLSQVGRLVRDFTNSQVTSLDALRAATAYKDIVDGLKVAAEASANAADVSEQAKEKVRAHF
jgi:hypothetical protein